MNGEIFRWQAHAILALQEAAEVFMIHLFEDAYVLVYIGTTVLYTPSE